MKPTRQLCRALAPFTAVTALLSLSACSSGGSDSGLTLWYRPGSIPTAAVEGVQKQFPKVKLNLVKVPDLEQKLKLALQTGSGTPDIAVIGNSISDYSSIEKKFADLKSLGADPTKDYVTSKWENGTTAGGRLIGFPIDTGPQGLFYRPDLFAKAGLPTDPDQVSALAATWEGYRALAEKASAAGFKACDNAGMVYTLRLTQKGQGFFDKSGAYIGGNALSKEAFDYSAGLITDGLCAKAAPYSTDWNSAVAQNKLGAFVGPVYEGGLLPGAGAKAGVWRVAKPPGGPGSQGGSYMTILSSSKDQKDAFQIVKWMLNSANQAAGYVKDGLFPSALGSFDDPQLTAGQEFYGGQKVGVLFGDVVKNSPTVLRIAKSPAVEGAMASALTSVAQGKESPADAWTSAQKQITEQLKQG